MIKMTTSLVTPGTKVANVGDVEAGEGTMVIDDSIVSTTVGQMNINDGVVTVQAGKEIVDIAIGDTIICNLKNFRKRVEKPESLSLKAKRVRFFQVNCKVISMLLVLPIDSSTPLPMLFDEEMWPELLSLK